MQMSKTFKTGAAITIAFSLGGCVVVPTAESTEQAVGTPVVTSEVERNRKAAAQYGSGSAGGGGSGPSIGGGSGGGGGGGGGWS